MGSTTRDPGRAARGLASGTLARAGGTPTLPKSVSSLRGDRRAIASNGKVTRGSQAFGITTASFPPVYPGTLAANRDPGHYDPVWPPNDVTLEWWYNWWPLDLPPEYPYQRTHGTYADWMNEHKEAFGGTTHAYVVWSDGRCRSVRSPCHPQRQQLDIRWGRVSWPVL